MIGLIGSLSYTETPTVTWSLPDSREYFGRLMSPMGADELTVLAQSVWDPERVLPVGLKKKYPIGIVDTADSSVEQLR